MGLRGMQKRFRSIKESPSAGPEETEESRMMETMSSSGQNRKVNFQVKLEPPSLAEEGDGFCSPCTPLCYLQPHSLSGNRLGRKITTIYCSEGVRSFILAMSLLATTRIALLQNSLLAVLFCYQAS